MPRYTLSNKAIIFMKHHWILTLRTYFPLRKEITLTRMNDLLASPSPVRSIMYEWINVCTTFTIWFPLYHDNCHEKSRDLSTNGRLNDRDAACCLVPQFIWINIINRILWVLTQIFNLKLSHNDIKMDA